MFTLRNRNDALKLAARNGVPFLFGDETIEPARARKELSRQRQAKIGQRFENEINSRQRFG